MKTVMCYYLSPPAYEDKDASQLTSVRHTDEDSQLNDLELFIGNDARTLVTALEDEMDQAEVKNFIR